MQTLSVSNPYRVFAQSHVEEANPGGVILAVESGVLQGLLHEEERLGEAKQDDDVDHAEGEHVSRDHAEYHRHERSGQFDGSETWYHRMHHKVFQGKFIGYPAKNIR